MPQSPDSRLDLPALRRHAVARSLFTPTTLLKAIEKLGGFVQADPLRAPARAQDLTLRHRVKGYQAGDLERRYPRLPLQEDFFINYGFVTPELRALMHPRTARRVWEEPRWQLARAVLAEVERLGEAHPAQVDAALGHGPVKNWFGGNSRLSTELLDGLHYRGHLDVVRRDSGTRVYRLAEGWQAHADPQAAMDAMADVLVRKYAPLPAGSLSQLINMLFHGAHQWESLRKTTLQRAKERLGHATIDGTDWYWPADEDPARGWRIPSQVRLLAPFDPVVWDRRRFELLWGWAYRFEAYTPAAKRVRGHYALPLLWRDQVIGWANAGVRGGQLQVDCGYVSGRAPRDAGFKAALEEEIQRLTGFLGL
ncbi:MULTISPECIES: DNA glycosylase AlkZ-like family protein [unclassified Roseateles]|uniref:DNA glycosylase AlkZ-like family protein n=1 Tax=unclassified Roseateles TaxID=2626991 RepID=UPI0006F48DFF|nr:MULTISPECIES: crosslink repair DNA glycosylase YcaQ family protein [unclassified Roseateles]KQW51281.1 cytoplasmic protein [Pelomonas sp. Root405]KRA77513.1 cytoplasmic protein [Pelomonas sp. Root662]